MAAFVLRNLHAARTDIFVLFVLPYVLTSLTVVVMLTLSIFNRPREVDDSWQTFLLAFAASNLVPLMSLAGVNLIGSHIDPVVEFFGRVAMLLTVPAYAVALFTLGKNLTVLPEAHALKTTGIYSLSRHPLYAIYVLWYLLQVFIVQSIAIVPISLAQIALQVMRARAEEKVLSRAFPEYEEYRKSVGWYGRRAA